MVARRSHERARPPAGSRGTITSKDLDRLFEFSKQSGWRLILGLNLGHYDPATFADEATYAMENGGTSLLALEIGNEPDLFMRNGLRNSNWSYDDFRREFQAYADAIVARAPEAPLSGPTTCCSLGPEWFSRFVSDEASRLVFASHHIYPMSAAQTNPDAPSFPTIPRLLSPELMKRVAELVSRLASAADARHLQLRIAETNSASRGGKEGVSNTFASALWGADYAFTLAEQGAAALNFHGGFACRGYTAICYENGQPPPQARGPLEANAGFPSVSAAPGGHFVARPLYYGMLLFHLAASGRLVPADVRAPGNLTAHAVLASDGTLRVVLLNKDSQKSMTVEISGDWGNRRSPMQAHFRPYHHATALRLAAPALDSTTGIRLGGGAVNADGSWSPMPGEKLKKRKNAFRLEIPPATAALAQLK